jgi:hypothetical protein
MTTMFKIAVVAPALGWMLFADIPLLPLQLVPEAHAILGVRRRTAVVAYSAGAATPSAAAHSQQAAAQQQAAAAQYPAAAPAPAAPQPAAAGTPLPQGTVVSALPGGCVPTPVGGVEYYYCGGNFYRAMFQGNTLVYVTAKP